MHAQGAPEISLHTRKACQQWYKDINGSTAQRPETQNATDCSSDACIIISVVVQELLSFLLALSSILLCSTKTRNRNATAAVILSLSLPLSMYGTSEQLLVRLTKQNRSREMYSPIRQHTRNILTFWHFDNTQGTFWQSSSGEENACVSLFLVCCHIGEYISLEQFYKYIYTHTHAHQSVGFLM